MAIDIRCLQCGQTYHAPDHLAGKTIRCRECGRHVQVPSPKTGTVPAVRQRPASAAPAASVPAPPPSKPPAIVPKLGAKPVAGSASRQSASPQRHNAAQAGYMPSHTQPYPHSAVPQPGLPQHNPGSLSAGFDTQLSTQPSPYHSPRTGGGGELTASLLQGLIGLVLLGVGAGLYWAYSSFTHVATIGERRQEALQQIIERTNQSSPSSASREESRRQLEARIAELRAQLKERESANRGRPAE